MTQTPNTSPEGGATPNPGPATGTNATVGATPTAAALTLEEALKKLADLEHSNGNALEEVERHRKRLTAYEKKEQAEAAAKKLADEAELSEAAKATKRATEAEQRVQQIQQQLTTAQVKLAAQTKGIIDPELAALAIAGKLEYGEDGMPTNVEKALDDLIKAKPYLKPEPPAAPSAPETQRQPATPAVPYTPNIGNPGRANTLQPGTLAPGKSVRLEDVQWSR